tara:strand:- start:603 stop:1004 length:402 start_codon:yes stop_codon:yes gene_type:complete
MKKEINYPSSDKIVEYNLLILNLIKVKKADEAKVLSISRIYDIIRECKESEKDIYSKAMILLKGLIQKHPFASGNRRTAFIVTKDFLLNNEAKFKIKDDPDYAKVMVGIREGYYTDNEVKEWIENGKIKKFRR